VAADCSISSKEKTKVQRPSQAYIDVEFRKDSETTFFSYLIFQNYYCHQITVKQFTGKNSTDKKDEKNWKTVLKNYTLMENPHYETDAQNWHIIGTELFNQKFDRRSLKHLRIYLKQPSPSWLDYNIREIQMYMKKTNSKSAMNIYENNDGDSKTTSNPFDSFKSQIKRNIKNMKKE
jgi:hypothetical protein